MYLNELLEIFQTAKVPQQFQKYSIESICCDSRNTEKNSLFVVLRGHNLDGSQFIKDAIDKGAIVVVCEIGQMSSLKSKIPKEIFLLGVPDTKDFLKKVVLKFYGHPSQKVRTVGVTGTNGKTTMTYLMESILRTVGHKTAVVGTINCRIGDQIFPSINTTPGLLDNQKFLSELARCKIEYCLMEVSSHALDQGRVDLIEFRTAIFTNLTQDHLDYHKTMENYFEAKSKLFKELSSKATAVINIDDVYGVRLVSLTKAKVITFGMKANADVRAQDIHYGLDGTSLAIKTPEGRIQIHTRLIGQHNVYNILGAVAAILSEGIPLTTIKKGLELFTAVPGRLEAVDAGQDFFVFIDYAHTEDGLVNVLKSLRAVSRFKIILVFGCGGDRDKSKRPQMGKAACQLADYSIVTTDNCRSEDPPKIIQEILSGFTNKNYEVIVDRKEAIHRALSIAEKGQIVVLAGKGHEMVQIFKDRTLKFNERQIVEDYIHSLKKLTHV